MSITLEERELLEPEWMENEESFSEYLGEGGEIDRDAFDALLEKAKITKDVDQFSKIGAESMARFAKIELQNTENSIDPRTILYGVLRGDASSTGMSDQRLFAAVLKIKADQDSLGKMIKAYSQIFPQNSRVEENKFDKEDYRKAA